MFITVLSAAPATPAPSSAECEAPPLRDVAGLPSFAQKSGALSVGLDSVATWCFDSGGEWTGGVKVEPGKKAKPPGAAVGDCARALASCEAAKLAVTADLKALLAAALADLERPYVKKKYVPKRSGLADRPSEVVDCTSRSRPELFAQAQARMDLARLASQLHSEYANYKTWLYAEGLKCAQAARLGQVDNTQRAMAVDSAPQAPTPNPDKNAASTSAAAKPPDASVAVATTNTPDGSVTAAATTSKADGTPTAAPNKPDGSVPVAAPAVVASKPDAGTAAVANTVTPPSTPLAATNAADSGVPAPVGSVAPSAGGGSPGVDAGVAALLTGLDPSKPVGLSGSSSERERMLALAPAEKWAALAQVRGKFELDRDFTLGFLASRELRDCRCPRPNPAGIARRYVQKDNVAQLEADEQRNTQCEFCLQDAFSAWRSRVDRQCALVEKLSDFEVGVLQRSDDGNGLPPRCFDSVLTRRDGGVGALAGTGTSALARADAGTVWAAASKTVVAPVTPLPAPTPTSPPGATTSMQSVTSPLADTFSRAQDWAPIPLREDGRLYVRIFMSSACAADVLPGPIQARTGDLLVIPYNARQLSVRSPCGGLAEVYWGREVKPRVSEIFARNQPLHLQFQPQ